MKRLLVTLATVVLLVAPAQVHAASYVRSTVWRPGWATYPFPAPPGDSTPQFITRYVQLPATVAAGDLVIVSGAEEFSNPADFHTSGDPYTDPQTGARTEHWSTPVFGSGELVRYDAALPGEVPPTDPLVWRPIVHGLGENWNNTQHHWVWQDTSMFRATSTTASDYVGLRFYFGRSPGYRDPFNDYIVAERTYGRIEAGVAK